MSAGVDPDEKVGGRTGFVTKPFTAGGLGRCKPPAGSGAEPRRQTHLGKTVSKLGFISYL